MRVLVVDETRPGENRVALLPDAARKVIALGLDVAIVEGAGASAFASDDDYIAAGVEIVPRDYREQAMARSDVLLSVRPLDPLDAERIKRGALTLSFLQPVADIDTVAAVRDVYGTALSFDLVPRISRAQSMDALTSQALVTGYRGALVAAEHLPKFFPLFMTAAGTIPPAKVLVLGAGVAGLQSIATARRLGAVVSAYDVRPSSADEVRSMGATFITLDLDALEGGGGYAREMSEDRAARQRELLTPTIAESDVVITTAAVPGRPAPLLMTRDMVAAMKAGSIVVDLAAESGGNVEGSIAGQIVDVDGVSLWGALDVASSMPVHASQLFSANVVALLTLLTEEGEVTLDLEDEIVIGCTVVLNGEVRNEAAIDFLTKEG